VAIAGPGIDPKLSFGSAYITFTLLAPRTVFKGIQPRRNRRGFLFASMSTFGCGLETNTIGWRVDTGRCGVPACSYFQKNRLVARARFFAWPFKAPDTTCGTFNSWHTPDAYRVEVFRRNQLLAARAGM
jgi:hypothetical protein